MGRRSDDREVERLRAELGRARAEVRRARRALREREARYRMIARATNDVIWDWDVETGQLTWNQAIETNFGYPRHEVEGTITWWQRHVHPEDRQRVIDSLEAAVTGDRDHWSAEYRFRRGDATYATVYDRGYIARDEDGRAVRMIGAMIDVTGQRRAVAERERLLEAAEAERARFDAVIRNVPVGIMLAEAPSGRIVMANSEVRRILGHEAISSPTVEDYSEWTGFHPDGRRIEPEEWPLARALDGEVVRGEDFRYRRGDGTMTWIRVNAAPIQARGGRVIGAVVAFFDIADEKRVQEHQRFLSDASGLLARSLDVEDTLDRLARLAVERIADHCIIDILVEDERGVRRVAIASRDPAQQKLLEQMRRFPPDPAGHPLARVLEEGRSILVRDVTDDWLRSVAEDDEHFALMRTLAPRSTILVPMRARGETFGAITLALTGTARRYEADDLQLAESLARRTALAVDNARLYHEAQAASRAKSEFLAVMSHELRTPLTAIIGFTDLLEEGIGGALTDAQHSNTERIKASAFHLRDIIDEILAFSRLEAGREHAIAKHVDLTEIVRDTADIVEPAAQEKELRYDVELPDRSVEIETDPDKVRRILLNLINNAVAFTREGGVRIELEPQDRTVDIRVTDTGVGIAPEDRRRIFEPFWQVERGPTRRVTGTGVGLTVAQRLARMIGGDVTVDSEPGRGSTFTLTLPTIPPDQATRS